MVRRQTGLLVKRIAMTDFLMLVFTVAFFVLALVYVAACEKLR